ncbi:ABC transporter related protein [Kribbella flavida DSM 17836]|uniref:ABC transporter related protein n=1 Tax=Kribbella flavida (strain DSM 17836 / JCM 10339 / NBRC 14399) TaxID=479435 RepID=D2Q1N1_KRIFD|nr:ABC transporter ATP-binding protein [Kribbella flavida]ADB32020.1 ABC transporter related protein [Kribbella flavida DSM 17836]
MELSTRASLRDAVRTAGESLTDAATGTPRWLVISAALLLAQAVLPGAQVVLLERVVEMLSEGRTSWAPLLGLTAVVGLMYPLGQVALAATQRMALRLRLQYRTELAYAAARLPPSRLARPDVTTDLEASQNATTAMDGVAGRTLQVLGAAVTAVVLCAVVWQINPLSGLLVAAALVPTVLAFTAIARMEARGWPDVAAADRRAAYATEQLVQQRSGTELAVLGSGRKVAALVGLRRGAATTVLDRMVGKAMLWELAAALATAVLFGAALVALVAGGASGAGAAAAVAGTISGLNAIRLCGYAFGTIITAAPQARIYRRFVASVPASVPQTVVRDVGSVCLENVGFSYPGADQEALRGVSIRAERGEMIALVGVNGAGKTTAVNVLVGMLTPSSGRVLIDGRDAAVLSESERLGHFGLLVQEFGKFEFSLREVVGLGAPGPVDDDGVRRALVSAEAETFTRRLADGLSSQLGQQWGGTGVSGGQWQRLALARIYLRAAGIWILDEPTSAIDAEAEREIFTELRRTRHERITIVVSHRAWTLREMDRIYVLDDGVVVQQGRYEQLLGVRDGRFARIFAGQARGDD